MEIFAYAHAREMCAKLHALGAELRERSCFEQGADAIGMASFMRPILDSGDDLIDQRMVLIGGFEDAGIVECNSSLGRRGSFKDLDQRR